MVAFVKMIFSLWAIAASAVVGVALGADIRYKRKLRKHMKERKR